MTLEELKHKSEQYYYIVEDGEIRESLGYCSDIYTGDKVMDLDNLIAIPDNATNGDMIKAMFPNWKVEMVRKMSGLDRIDVNMPTTSKLYTTHSFDLDWWNAPYKAESEE